MSAPEIRALPVSAWDEREGVDSRHELRWPDAGDPLGYQLVVVIHVRGNVGRFAGPGYYVCSRCQEVDDPRQPEQGTACCRDVAVVRQFQGKAAK